MESPISGFSPPVIAALGWALLHFLWQGLSIAALAAAAFQTCRRAQTRYLIGLTALVAMLAAPVMTFFSLVDFSSGAAPVSPLHAQLSPALLSSLVDAWICGVAIFGLRFAAGLAGLASHRHSRAVGASLLALCHQVQERLGITRAIRYLECNTLTAPAGFGLLRPVILLPASLIGLSEEQLRAVIAHELAHVRRWDFAVNLFQTAVETLLFYHPAIWWLNKRIRAEREICCDEIAVAASGNRQAYARALVALAQAERAPSLAMAINRGGLAHRISRLLEEERFDGRAFAAVMVGSLLLLMLSLGSGNLLSVASHVSQSIRRPVQPIARYLPEHFPAAATIIHAPRPRFVAAAIHPRTRVISIPLPQLPPAAMPDKDVMVEAEPASTPEGEEPSLQQIAVADAPPDLIARQAGIQAGFHAGMLAARHYPAPLLAMNASRGVFEWERPEASAYCDKYAQQTVTQGANEPLVVDDAAKERYAFFYWHCMMRNGQMQGGSGPGPAYAPLGAASSDQPANAAGTWAVAFGPFPAARSCTFTQDGNVLTGTCARSEGSGTIHGVVDGMQLRWSWTYLDDQKLPAEIDFIGLIGPDGTITGQAIQMPADWAGHFQTFAARPGAPISQIASRDD